VNRSCGRATCATLLLATLLSPFPSCAQESRLQELNSQIAQLVRQGKSADAVPVATEALKVALATYGAASAQVASALSTLGLTYYYQGKYPQAEPIFQRAVEIAEKAAGPDSPDFASDLSNLALNDAQQGKLSDAIPLLQRTVSIYEKALGPDNPKVALALNGLATMFVRQARYTQAEPLLFRAEVIFEKVLGPDRLDLVSALNGLADVYVHEGKYAQAEPLYQRSLAIYEKNLIPLHPEIANALNRLADAYLKDQKYALAAPLHQRALDMAEKVLGAQDIRLTTDLSDLALDYLKLGKYAESESLYQRALALYEKADGPDHPDVAQALNNLADVYSTEGKNAEAESLYQRALAIREKAFGPDDVRLGATLGDLAVLSMHEGKYVQAEALYQRVIRIHENSPSVDPHNAAAVLDNLANLYITTGRYALAEPLLQRALEMTQKAYGPESASTAYALNNLASLNLLEGRYDQAETLFKQSLAIREKALGPDHADVAVALVNLGNLYQIEGNLHAAKPLYLRALGIQVKALGKDDPTLANTYLSVANFLLAERSFPQAESFYQQALAIDEKVLGSNHPEVASDLDGLGLVYGEEGKYDAAEPLHMRAIRIREDAFGPDSPDVGMALQNLALMYDEEGKYAQAEPVYARTFDNIFHQFQYSFTYMTESDRLSYLGKVSGSFPAYFSFIHRFHEKDPALAGSMYNLLLWEKGFVAGSVANMRRMIEASGDTESQKLLAQLTEKRTQIAALLNVKPANREQWRSQIDQLQTEADNLEKALVARSTTFAEHKKLERATWRQVRDALKPGEAAVEFARFNYIDKRWTGATYYVALVVTHETRDNPQYIFLGDDKQVESGALVQFKQSVQSRGLSTEPETKLPGADAYQVIWKPLEKSLAGITRIDIAADGALNEIPLGIISAPDGKLEMEKYDLRLLSSTKDILLSSPSRLEATALLVGDPDFDLSVEKQQAAVRKLGLPVQRAAETDLALPTGNRGNEQPGVSTLPRLPGTGAEVSAIAAMMQKQAWKTAVYTGDEALKTVVEHTSSPRVIHLATHGFFLPDQQIEAQQPGDARAVRSEARPSAVSDPMLRSGLYFAGADRALAGNPSPPGLDNGILTALEAGNLDLTGTQLIVLSACNTGQGDVRNGEGVFGLRRALQEAGAQSILMTLWSVPDKETLDLMQRFYSKWLVGVEVHQALKEAQLEVREQVKADHDGKDLPYYWGAFVLVGR